MEPTSGAGRGRLPGHAAGARSPCPAGARTAPAAWLGDNAIHAAAPVLAAARRLRRRATSRSTAAPTARASTRSRIAGGVAGNVMPDACTVTRQLPLRARPLRGRGARARARGVRAVRLRAHRHRRGALPGLTAPAAAHFVEAVGGDAGGEVRLDRRRPVRRPRHPGAQLRPGRSQPRPHPRGARRHACGSPGCAACGCCARTSARTTPRRRVAVGGHLTPEDTVSTDLTGKTVAFLVAPEGIEQVELTEPWKAVEEAGGTPQLVVHRGRRGAGVQPPRQGRHLPGRRHRGHADATTTTRWCCPAGSPTPTSCAPSRPPWLRQGLLRRGQAGRGDLPRGRGRWSRPTCCAAARSPAGRACRPTSATPAAPGSTRRSYVDTDGPNTLVDQPQPRRPAGLRQEARRGLRGLTGLGCMTTRTGSGSRPGRLPLPSSLRPAGSPASTGSRRAGTPAPSSPRARRGLRGLRRRRGGSPAAAACTRRSSAARERGGFVWIGLHQPGRPRAAGGRGRVRPAPARGRGRRARPPAAQARDVRRRPAVRRPQDGALRRPRGGHRDRRADGLRRAATTSSRSATARRPRWPAYEVISRPGPTCSRSARPPCCTPCVDRVVDGYVPAAEGGRGGRRRDRGAGLRHPGASRPSASTSSSAR